MDNIMSENIIFVRTILYPDSKEYQEEVLIEV